MSTRLAPLYKLLSKKEMRKWISVQDQAFNESNELMTSSKWLVHFDSELPLLLACNASAYVRNYHHGDKWLSGVIQQKTGPVSYQISLANGKDICCHLDQVRSHSVLLGNHIQNILVLQ